MIFAGLSVPFFFNLHSHKTECQIEMMLGLRKENNEFVNIRGITFLACIIHKFPASKVDQLPKSICWR